MISSDPTGSAASSIPLDEDASARAPLRSRVLNAALDDGAALDDFVSGSDVSAICTWFGVDKLKRIDATALRLMIDRDLAEIEDVLARSCDAVLHHPRFQALESAWRGVAWLCRGLGVDGMSQIRLLDCRWSELARDLERAAEFDQSALFELVYNQEFGMPGGVPFSLIVGLYEISHRPVKGSTIDDVAALRALSRVGAAAFAPIVMGASPAMFAVDRFGELELRQSLAGVLSDAEHRRLQSFAESSDARFIALAAPRLLMRNPYGGRDAGDCGFRYDERLGRVGQDELWGNAALAIAHVCIRAFNDHRWLAAIRGTIPDEITAGVIADLPIADFATDSTAVALKFPLEINLSATLERDMSEAGLICLKRCKDTPYLALYNLPTLYRPPRNFTSDIARSNAQLGAMLNYVLCVSRFAHYLKVIAREWIGSLKTAKDCEDKLQAWLHKFTSAGDRLSYATKARYPLQEARIRVYDKPEQPGAYECIVHLKPHFQLDQAVSEFQLTTTLFGAEHAF